MSPMQQIVIIWVERLGELEVLLQAKPTTAGLEKLLVNALASNLKSIKLCHRCATYWPAANDAQAMRGVQ